MLPKNFWKHVEKTSACWLWTANKNQKGYGRVKVEGVMLSAHRVSYLHFVGAIPDGLELDHLCRNRGCVNPFHMEPVTHRENVKRGQAGVLRSQWAHCANGHTFDSENTYINPTNLKRSCRACHVRWDKEFRERKSLTTKELTA